MQQIKCMRNLASRYIAATISYSLLNLNTLLRHFTKFKTEYRQIEKRVQLIYMIYLLLHNFTL